MKKKERNWRKQDKINQKKRYTARKKSACVASPISRSPRESPCFPTKEPGNEKALHVTLHTLPGLWQLCHGRQFRSWQSHTMNCPFLRSKGKLLLYSNGFLFHFRVFSNFLSKLGPFKSAICLFDDFQGESLPHVKRKRWDVKDMFLVLISTNPYFSFRFV